MGFDWPRPGFMRTGQPYWHVGRRDHTTRDGRSIVLEMWQSFCAECGEPFVCACPIDGNPETRRCNEHRQALKRVPKRGKRLP